MEESVIKTTKKAEKKKKLENCAENWANTSNRKVSNKYNISNIEGKAVSRIKSDVYSKSSPFVD